ncbi:MAG TPA: 16S rRNA (cytidine(1402)-2'-O)-methyltransferase [Candidatus Sulfotelmatobacter sp.]|nr:16S rRNA (cytidine(1402)-2'-O)-methyltransferase [Candidatus Sulfotelmatobacter sp.]
MAGKPSSANASAGKLFIVATPIGNLEDITFRAVRVMAEVDLIAAEDTRHSKILLTKYNINTPLTSYHKFNIKAKTEHLVNLLAGGKNIALISDSGMPGVSDPGEEVVKAAVERNIKVEVIPGPSASLTALAVSGLPTDRFIFEGFLPKKPGKKVKKLNELKSETGTIIIYESPFRTLKTLQNIYDIMGDCQVAVCRELTKMFEEVVRGPVSEVLSKLSEKGVKGEVVIVVSRRAAQRERDS